MQVPCRFLPLVVSLLGLGGCVVPLPGENRGARGKVDDRSDAAGRKDEDSAKDVEGRLVSEVAIRYVGPKTIEEERLRVFIRTTSHSRYKSERVDEDIKSLYESGLVNDVRVQAELKRGGVEVVYEVKTRPRMGPSPFVGNTVFSDQRLALESELVVGDRLDRASLSAAARKIEAYYQRHGYTQAKVTVRDNAWGANEPEDFQFIIEEGPTSR